MKEPVKLTKKEKEVFGCFGMPEKARTKCLAKRGYHDVTVDHPVIQSLISKGFVSADLEYLRALGVADLAHDCGDFDVTVTGMRRLLGAPEDEENIFSEFEQRVQAVLKSKKKKKK